MLQETRNRMENYVRRGARAVSGWLAPESARAIALLAELQIGRGTTGGVGEIGIHHGKLFLLLYLSLQAGERAFAVDLFGDQQRNTDASGRGDKESFLCNLARVGGEPGRVTIFEQDSTTLDPARIRDAVGPVRMMSVDGGHTQQATYSDLALAEAVLVPGGILIVDDVYNERWPAVAAGVCAFMLEPGTRLRPFAITPNKTYFCKDPIVAAEYRRRLAEAFGSLILSRAEMFGSDILVLGRKTLTNRIRNLPMVSNNPRLYLRLSRILHRFG